MKWQYFFVLSLIGLINYSCTKDDLAADRAPKQQELFTSVEAQDRNGSCPRESVICAHLTTAQHPNPFSSGSLVGELDDVMRCMVEINQQACGGGFDPGGAGTGGGLEVHIITPDEPIATFCTDLALFACHDDDLYAPLKPSIFTVAAQDEILNAAAAYAEANVPCEVGPNGWINIEYDFYFGETDCDKCGKKACESTEDCSPFYNYYINVDIRYTCCDG